MTITSARGGFSTDEHLRIDREGHDRSGRGAAKPDLTPEEEKKVEELRKRDAEVRRHEQAHRSAAGSYARSGPKYEFETGPDGQRYAVAGEVDIDTAPVPDDPKATMEKARIVKRAALAPENPSAQDRRVAQEADKMLADAQRELAPKNLGGSSSGNYDARGRKSAQAATSSFHIAA